MYGLYRLDGTLTTKSPLMHMGMEKTGNTALLNRMRYIVNGQPMDMPILSGNAIRGYLRREIMADMLRMVDYFPKVDTKQGLALYHALFTGGVLETTKDDDVGAVGLDLAMKRKIYAAIPALRLFGTSWGNQMLEGKLKVGIGIPACTELANYLPPGVARPDAISIFDMLGSAFQTRRDDVGLVSDEEKSRQMIVEYEVIAPGSVFHHRLSLEDPTDLDISTLGRVIQLWREKPFIGGKSGIGMGELEIAYPLAPSSETYCRWIADNRDKVVDVLREMGE